MKAIVTNVDHENQKIFLETECGYLTWMPFSLNIDKGDRIIGFASGKLLNDQYLHFSFMRKRV